MTTATATAVRAAPAATTTPMRSPARTATPPTTGRGAVAARLVRGERDKLWSLHSTWWSLAGAAVAMVGLAAAFTLSAGDFNDGANPMGPTELSLAGYQLAQLVFAALGVIVVTGEYATGTIRSTFAATPARWPVVLAKVAALTALVLPTTLVAGLGSFLTGQALLGADTAASLDDPGVLRVLVGTALYLTAVALLGSAVGWLLRSTAAATSTVLALVLVLPLFGQLLPAGWGPDVTRWLPSNAAANLMRVDPQPGGFGPWTGYAVLVGWVALVLAAAAVRLRRQDA